MRNLFILFLLFFCYGFSVTPASAAVLKVESDFSSLHVGDVFSVDLVIDTERQLLNAVETEVLFPVELLEYVANDDGQSVINLWIDKPRYHNLNLISFSGITPGGFSGTEIKLLSLTFKVVKVGQGNIEINQANLLVHDGLGTPAAVAKQNLHIAVSEGVSDIVVNTFDDERPEAFMPVIIQDADVFDGANTLVFTTEDKGSGLDHFEVKEGWFGLYQDAVSPYRLENQALDKKIFIKAVDRLKNERVEILYPQNWQPWYQYTPLTVSILILCVVIFLISGRFVHSLLRK
jgi:hypothetical protein